MNQAYAGARAIQIQGRYSGRVLTANHSHILVVVGMGFCVVVGNLGQVFSRDIQVVGDIVISCRQDYFPGSVAANLVILGLSLQKKIPVASFYA